MKILAGDIGGTKTLLAIVEVAEHRIDILYEERYKSSDFDGLASIIHAFRPKVETAVESACFAVAGPVVGDAFTGPNLAWSVQITKLGETIGIPRTAVINDFRAVGEGLTRLTEEDFLVLQKGEIRRGGAIGLLGAGTGLGEAYLTWQGGRYRVHASEGGHCDFAPSEPIEVGLLEHFREKHDHVSYERVVSGPGLTDIYRYLTHTKRAAETEVVRDEMECEDPAAVISRHAISGDDEASVEALHIFVSVFGAEAGNVALKFLATGGIYLAGGIAPKIIEKLKDGTFVQAFRRKGRHSDLLSTIPISVILNPRVGLLGAAAVAFDLHH